ncbi:MAG: GyrI-like domain-containing protein [Methanobacteriaceae archaeon]|nr:GyrI-like domain-containing protein [Methanobacteriaceae archaeon]
MEIKEKRVPSRKVAYVPHTDSFQKIPEFIDEVIQLVQENGLELTGLVYGTYHNGIKELVETRQDFEIGVSIKDFQADGNPAGRIGKLGLKEITDHTVLSAIHKGSHKTFNKTVEELVNYSLANNYDIVGPITEIYLPSFSEKKVEDQKTEIQIPVINMNPQK